MKNEKKRNLRSAAALAVAVAAVAVLFSLFTVYGAGGTSKYLSPSIFINDEPYRYDDNTPLLMIEGEYYVPAAIFSYIGVSSETRDDVSSFVLFRRESGTDSYISFVIDTPEALTNGGKISVPPPRKVGATLYIPLAVTCGCLSVPFDISTNYGELDDYSVAIRIFDGSARLTMPRLLESYRKTTATVSEKPQTQTSGNDGTETTPQGTETPDGKRRILLCIIPEAEQLDTILELLYEYNAQAAIFVDSDFIKDHPKSVIEILASGNYVGLKLDYAVRYDYELEAELKKANDLLLSTAKCVSRLVIYDFDNDDFRIAAISDAAAMKRAGCKLILPDVYFNDRSMDIPARTLRQITESGSTVIEISGNVSEDALRETLEFIYEYSPDKPTVVLPTEVSAQ